MFDAFTKKMEKYPGKKYMELTPAQRDTFKDELQEMSKELCEVLGADALYMYPRLQGVGAANYFHDCNAADVMNIIENGLARISDVYHPGVFEAISAYRAKQEGVVSEDGSDIFARVVSELPADQQKAIKASLVKIKKKLEGEVKGDSSDGEDDAIKDLLG